MRWNYCINAVSDMMFFQEKQILHFAFLVPYFFTAHVKLEMVFVTMACISALHLVWMGLGSEMMRYLAYSFATNKRIKVIVFNIYIVFFHFFFI